MDLNATIDIIIKDLNEAREIIDDLKKYPGVPALQIELAKSKCKSAAEVIALLKSTQDKTTTGKEVKIQVEEIIVVDEVITKEIPLIQTSEEEQRQVISVQVTEEVPEKKEEPKQAVKKITESAIIADQFSNMPTSFNEQLGSLKHEDDISEILKTKPLANLSDAIGVNDRFFFIREIFNGNHESYYQAISKLDIVDSLSDAMAVIMSYTGENVDNYAVKQLIALVKRKLPSNE
jgi:hypothetical protein